VYLFGAVNPRTGQSSALLAPTVNTQYMNHPLRFISEQAGADVQVIMVLDGAGWHVAKALEVPSNLPADIGLTVGMVSGQVYVKSSTGGIDKIPAEKV